MRNSVCLTALLAGLALAGCSPRPNGAWQGYLEGEFVYVASPLAGALTNLAVSRGAEVKAGQLLFELERTSETAAVREAEQRLAQAGAQVANLTKGRRATEIASLEAQLDRAKANLRLSESELARRARLIESKVISPEEVDQARNRRDADLAQVASLAADLETARLGARADEIKAAEAEVLALKATLAKAEWTVAQKTQTAPTNAWVYDTLYRQGEFVAAGNPVVALLPPENIKVRFFVPEAGFAALKAGDRVRVTITGRPELEARISYLSPQPEYTPPVLYNRENRAKLVFMVEALFDPAAARDLHPGQPADVMPVRSNP